MPMHGSSLRPLQLNVTGMFLGQLVGRLVGREKKNKTNNYLIKFPVINYITLQYKTTYFHKNLQNHNVQYTIQHTMCHNNVISHPGKSISTHSAFTIFWDNHRTSLWQKANKTCIASCWQPWQNDHGRLWFSGHVLASYLHFFLQCIENRPQAYRRLSWSGLSLVPRLPNIFNTREKRGYLMSHAWRFRCKDTVYVSKGD